MTENALRKPKVIDYSDDSEDEDDEDAEDQEEEDEDVKTTNKSRPSITIPLPALTVDVADVADLSVVSNVADVSEDNDNDIDLEVDDLSSFRAEFRINGEGYEIRNLITYLKGFHQRGNFRFAADYIRFEEASSSNAALNILEIDTAELYNYKFSSKAREIIMGVSLSDVHNVSKTIGKKDGVVFYKEPNDRILYVQVINHDTRTESPSNVCIIKTQTVEHKKYTIPPYANTERHPNFHMASTSFVKACVAISSVKCELVTIHGHGRWAVMKAIREGGIAGRIERLGQVDDQVRPVSPSETTITVDAITRPQAPRPKLLLRNTPAPEEPTLKLHRDTVKALSKLNNLLANGTIKFYLEPNKPLKLISRVGAYGMLRTYLRSYEPASKRASLV